METLLIFGVLSVAFSVASTLIYLKQVRAGNARPHRWTWLVWTLLGVITVASNVAGGARWSLIMVAGQTTTTLLVFLVSLRRGVGGMTVPNLAMVALALVGIGGWATSSEPVVATGCVVVADLIGVALMAPKTWSDPHSEPASAFALGVPTGVFGSLAVGRMDPALLMFPMYFVLANGLTAAMIAGRRQALTRRSCRARQVRPVRAAALIEALTTGPTRDPGRTEPSERARARDLSA